MTDPTFRSTNRNPAAVLLLPASRAASQGPG
jgi:hypothetical protein